MIHINLIPSNLWLLNLRKMLTDKTWTDLSLRIRTTQAWTCQACGIKLAQLKSQKWFHTHEMWNFNESLKEFSLVSLVCLCSKCHLATHIGFASVNQKHHQAIAQLCKVNHWTKSDVDLYLEAAFETWSRQSTIAWKCNPQSLETWLTPSELTQVMNFLKQHNLLS